MAKYFWILILIIFPTIKICQVRTYATLFWELYDAVSIGTRILHDVTEGVGTVSKVIKSIDSFMVTTDVQNSKNKKLKTDELPANGGCGMLSFQIKDDSLPIQNMVQCCNIQEICYSSACGVNKRECDSVLKSCLYSVCDEKAYDKTYQNNCRGAAKILFSGTMALSFQQYNIAQARSGCLKENKKDKKS